MKKSALFVGLLPGILFLLLWEFLVRNESTASVSVFLPLFDR